MCYVTSTELKQNLSHYIELSQKEDVYITKNSKVISVLSNPNTKAFFDFLSLRGCLDVDGKENNYKDIVAEEIIKKCNF